MTTEAASAAEQHDPPESPAGPAQPPRQRRRGGHASRGSDAPARAGADRLVTWLVTRAKDGDQQAWDALVEQYSPLIWSICRRHRLGGDDAADVSQSVWLELVDHLGNIRDPAALPGWPPRLGVDAFGSCGQGAGRGQPGMRWTPRTSPASRPGPRSTSCWRPGAAPRCAGRTGTCPRPTSG